MKTKIGRLAASKAGRMFKRSTIGWRSKAYSQPNMVLLSTNGCTASRHRWPIARRLGIVANLFFFSLHKTRDSQPVQFYVTVKLKRLLSTKTLQFSFRKGLDTQHIGPTIRILKENQGSSLITKTTFSSLSRQRKNKPVEYLTVNCDQPTRRRIQDTGNSPPLQC